MSKPSKVNKEEARRLYNEGLSCSEIARQFGVTRQYCSSLMKEIPTRRHGKIFDNIPYKGLYNLFQKERWLSIPRFATVIFGTSTRATSAKVYRLLSGDNVSLNISEIKRLIEYSGMSFEELFAPREG
jgi:hypothetical protein